ncbi:uncharacterized protein LOC128178928 [Crassostrea angulata]|uniref:uncharacterized protein LOC128178928 n=1 Tax=Magallana angulata TaxID=2784310 RepID=UPI0022B11B52|nr:uncharacterized protein LOC128178928 [Crassostrea angulata]
MEWELSTASVHKIRTQLKVSRTINGPTCIVHFPDGVSDLFDDPSPHSRSRHIPLLRFLRLFDLSMEISNASLPGDPNIYLENKTAFADKFIYVASSKLEIHQSFYTLSCLHLPFDCYTTLHYVGKSSHCKMLEMKNKNNMQWFARLFQQNIRIDPVTRKPLELDPSWREKYGPMCTGSSFVMEKLRRPDICLAKDHYKIQTSDIDSQNHTNWLAYVQICMNVCKQGLDQNLFSRLLIKNVENGLKEFQIRYENEALVDEDVVVHAWETSGSCDQLCFELTRGCDVCIQATMTFHRSLINNCHFYSQKAKI